MWQWMTGLHEHKEFDDQYSGWLRGTANRHDSTSRQANRARAIFTKYMG